MGEVFTHITVANYGIARALGTAFPGGYDSKAIQALSNDKPKLVQALKVLCALSPGDPCVERC